MTNILVTLLGGVFLITAIFVILYQVTNMSGKMVATVMAFAVTGTYVPISIFVWPGAEVFAMHVVKQVKRVLVFTGRLQR